MTARGPSGLRPSYSRPRSLSQLVAEFGLDVVGTASGLEISGVSLTTDDIEPGDLYVGVQGRQAHGAAFAQKARESGAVAILTDRRGASLIEDRAVPILVVPDPREALGEISAWIYRTTDDLPTVFGVTGTNGKTSVVYLLSAILAQIGVRSGLSSTVDRRIGDEVVTSSLTTPEASELHALLARMREADVRAAAIEVSAQALSRHRVDGLVFDVVGFTNLSHDHLDDYDSMADYFAAKRELFQPDRARRGVVCVDSEWGRRLLDESRIPVSTVGTVPGESDWVISVAEQTITRTAFRLSGPNGRSLDASVPLVGSFMAANAGLAIVMLVESGCDLDVIAHALNRDGGIDVYIPGRLERISGERGPLVFVDYGHTPDAFLRILASLRHSVSGRIIMVFGADGDRDKTKRHDMGRIAAENADVVVITDMNPRFENPAVIRSALLDGAREAVPRGELHEVADPREAFRHALSLAREGDAILYAGPGHEDYHDVNGEKIPYFAREDARQALRDVGWLSD